MGKTLFPLSPDSIFLQAGCGCWFQTVFGLPHAYVLTYVLTYPGNISLFLLGSPFVHPFPACFLFMFELNQEFPVQQAGCLPCLPLLPPFRRFFLHFVQIVIEVWVALMSSLAFRGSLMWNQFCLPAEVLCPCLPCCLQDHKLQHLTAPAVKTAIDWQFIFIQDSSKASPLVSYSALAQKICLSCIPEIWVSCDPSPAPVIRFYHG